MEGINHQELKEVIKRSYDTKVSLFIWGTFGIGKSDSVRQVAEDLKLDLIDVRVSQLEPSDLRGLPKINGDSETTKWLIPNWLPNNKDSKGILFFDELNLAVPSIQASCYQLILDRKIGDYKLPDGWVVVSAGNRIEDKGNIFEMPVPLANRFIHIELKIPEVERWCDWAFENKVDNRIISFLNFKPSRLFSYDSKSKDKSIATPRSWVFCSKLINEIDELGKLEILSSSAVGEGTAIEFVSFLKLNRKINIKDILDNPKKAKEIEEIDLKYALLSEASEYYRKNKKPETLKKILNVCEYVEPEFSVLMLRMVKAVDNEYFKKEIIKLKEFEKMSENYGKFLL